LQCFGFGVRAAAARRPTFGDDLIIVDNERADAGIGQVWPRLRRASKSAVCM